MSTFYYWESSNKHYFHLKDNNNEIILSSTEGYETEQACLKGIASVKVNAPLDERYYKFTGNDNQHYFRLKAANNEPIGKSEGYSSASKRDDGIANCKKEAPGADVKKK